MRAVIKEFGALLKWVRVNPSCGSCGGPIAGLSKLTDFLDQRLKLTGA